MSGHGIPRISGARETDKDVEDSKIATYTALVAEVQDRCRSQDYSLDALNATSRLLTKNPEYYTIWNFRRRLLEHLIAEEVKPAIVLVSSDLQFLVPLLAQYPKCYWIWNYRLWILHKIDGILDASGTSKFWQGELGLVNKMLTRDERNFHGWDYRRHVVHRIELLQGQRAERTLVESEFDYSTRMIQRALQNFSALHYRSKLIPRLLKERNSSPEQRRQFLEQEFDLMQDALIDPFNQSAWFYHQYLMSTLSKTCPDSAAIVLDLSDAERARYFNQEVERIRDILLDYDDCKWIYQALLRYHLDANQLLSCDPADMSHWLRELNRLDPMRARRWSDLDLHMKA